MEDEEIIKLQMEAARPDFDKYALFEDMKLAEVEINDDRLDFTKPYTPPKFLLSINGTKVLSVGNIHAVSGQAGHGKTMFISMLIAAVLDDDYENIRYELRDEENASVLYIDTEAGVDDTIDFKDRVLRMAKWNTNENTDAFTIIRLRDTDKAVERLRKSFRAIIDYRPTLAIIDGGLDVVEDFNDAKECAEIVYKFMRVASTYNVCVVIVIHQNPLTNSSSLEKLTGHLGSLLQRKVNDIFQVTKKKNLQAPYSYEVSNTKSRGHAPLEDWSFTIKIDAEGHPRPTPTQLPTISDQRAQSNNLPDAEDVKKWLHEHQDSIEWPATMRDCERLFKKAGVPDEQLRACVIIARNRTFIVEGKGKVGDRKPRYLLNRVHIREKTSTMASNPPQQPIDPNLPFEPPDGTPAPF